ncbi:hypothetical protein LEP1GSC127_2777 [Leptospira kirschneri str. 200801925]|uniref:Uncharacterized protein n=1 Tax=Leptospira kirschneri str. 200802841 TaxID=1193047 RepID=A0A828XYI0_9LEPT|nr:hypothetical protein LEP1GSC044_1774 [Leptospira kirschneri serovar Grippotyphosa str. RM52]EKO50272.1 hypothetical protein LEP1GSC131_2706 [Leptospira kirschneri str. 200802841]EKQ84037.1 hypothetical protein LEP1GSC064_3555 [Leptospira kirschneri serovar Grippotyphosa str. Moskva]EKR08378.1 hypothetical protein LEP1GSC122_3730 [Leptospira kirschneri serovar Valbuzzi str. 200702274]EMK03968.1 hypothetical protein LEP1GSC176_1752 [Leptospira kirschneri str. MMD1493]EMK17581.1 hypothetical p
MDQIIPYSLSHFLFNTSLSGKIKRKIFLENRAKLFGISI